MQMIVIQIASDDMLDLQVALTNNEIPHTVSIEDRYFGDNDVVSVLVEVTKSLSIFAPIVIKFLESKRRKSININGVDIPVSNPITDSEKELIRKALN